MPWKTLHLHSHELLRYVSIVTFTIDILHLTAHQLVVIVIEDNGLYKQYKDNNCNNFASIILFGFSKRPLYFLHAWQVVCECPWSRYAGMYITSDRVNSAVNGVGRGQMDTDNPAEYGFIRNRIVPLGLKQIVI